MPPSLWLREFEVTWGEFLDSPESARYLESYIFRPEYAYQSFNHWFSRNFKDFDRVRPVAQPDHPLASQCRRKPRSW